MADGIPTCLRPALWFSTVFHCTIEKSNTLAMSCCFHSVIITRSKYVKPFRRVLLKQTYIDILHLQLCSPNLPRAYF